jgi:hypothetical protein
MRKLHKAGTAAGRFDALCAASETRAFRRKTAFISNHRHSAAATSACLAWMRGTRPATLAAMPARIRSWRIRPASAGAASGTATRKPHQYRLGEDGGCFEAALTAVRNYGGVLEHPEDSLAWGYFGLMTPPPTGGWSAPMPSAAGPATSSRGTTATPRASRHGSTRSARLPVAGLGRANSASLSGCWTATATPRPGASASSP